MIRALALATAFLLPGLACAEPYPTYESVLVNDYAEVIGPEAEERIAKVLQELRDDTGVEATVLTIRSRKDYDASPSIEAFALGLFNNWGIGDATRNDGILILVARDDREMRVQLGAAYHQGFDVLAQEVINADFLPDFRDGDYQTGLERGTNAVIARIARPHAEGLPPPEPEKDGGTTLPFFFLAAAVIAVMRPVRNRIGDIVTRFRRCPKCGRRGLSRDRSIETQATKEAPGRGLTVTLCRNCDWRDEKSYTIPKRSSSRSSGGSFGGGRSSGGGATGRW
ncbi:TPM domain-containing protein [Ostreiculturibacter nitratireducens]|uniref:TPM domain-containing protein n=1 Tax=Ostreiculturibacter nitratireducens TaxID=3075226 RepID=UPI0031B5C276